MLNKIQKKQLTKRVISVLGRKIKKMFSKSATLHGQTFRRETRRIK